VMAVVVLSFFQPERKALDREVWKKTLKGIMTNPIIIGIVAGLIWSALRIPMPLILNKAVSSIGAGYRRRPEKTFRKNECHGRRIGYEVLSA